MENGLSSQLSFENISPPQTGHSSRFPRVPDLVNEACASYREKLFF
jgi:hypothetical protein